MENINTTARSHTTVKNHTGVGLPWVVRWSFIASSTGDVGSISGVRRTKITNPATTEPTSSKSSYSQKATSTRDPRTATRESPCTTTKAQPEFFFLIKRKNHTGVSRLVPGPGCWLLSNTGSAHWPASVPFLSPFSPGFLQSLSLCVGSYPSSKTYVLWLAISFTLEKDPSTSQELGSPISFTGFCSLYDTPRNRPDR